MIFYNRIDGDRKWIEHRFWEDSWLGDIPLCDQYPSLYRIANHPNVTVAHVMASTPLNIGVRRSLSGDQWDRWVHLVMRLTRIQLCDRDDKFRWKLISFGTFTLKYMYLDLLYGHTIFLNKYIWKIQNFYMVPS
jgi:hypothetical protein